MMPVKTIALAFAAVLAASSPAWAKDCPASGLIETLIEPAHIEDGFVKATSIVYALGSENRIHQAQYEILTQAEYDALDENMTYTTYAWKYAEYEARPIEVSTDTAKYDIILTPDGNQFHRPLDKPINQVPIEYHELVKPHYREETLVTQKRPEPEILKDGRLKVMMSPEHYEPMGGNRNGFGEHWQRYVKTRTPATYQQAECGED